MNICFFQGKIVSEINFKFVMKNEENLSSKHISICYFDILVGNEYIITAKAYNDMADFCYSKLETGDFINICGKLGQKYEVEIYELEKD